MLIQVMSGLSPKQNIALLDKFYHIFSQNGKKIIQT